MCGVTGIRLGVCASVVGRVSVPRRRCGGAAGKLVRVSSGEVAENGVGALGPWSVRDRRDRDGEGDRMGMEVRIARRPPNRRAGE